MTTTRTVRFDDELYELIEVTAGADERSLNGQIVWLVRAGLELRDMALKDGRIVPVLHNGQDQGT